MTSESEVADRPGRGYWAYIDQHGAPLRLPARFEPGQANTIATTSTFRTVPLRSQRMAALRSLESKRDRLPSSTDVLHSTPLQQKTEGIQSQTVQAASSPRTSPDAPPSAKTTPIPTPHLVQQAENRPLKPANSLVAQSTLFQSVGTLPDADDETETTKGRFPQQFDKSLQSWIRDNPGVPIPPIVTAITTALLSPFALKVPWLFSDNSILLPAASTLLQSIRKGSLVDFGTEEPKVVAAILIRYIDIHPLIPPSAAVALVAAINAQGIPNVASWRATMAGISNYAILRAIFDVFNTVTAFSAANSLNVPRLASIISQFIFPTLKKPQALQVSAIMLQKYALIFHS